MSLVYPQLVTGADLLRGITKLSEVAPLMNKRKTRAAAIVNSKLYGVRSFYKMMKKYHIHPVIGLTVHIQLTETAQVPIYVYAKNNDGFKNMMKMSSAIATREDETLPLRWLEAYCENCIVVLPLTYEQWNDEGIDNSLEQVLIHIEKATKVYIGISRPGGYIYKQEENVIQFASDKTLPIIAVYESRYIDKQDALAYEVAKGIVANEQLKTAKPLTREEQHYYLRKEEQLAEDFHDAPQWVLENEKMLMACHVSIEQTTLLLPKYPVQAKIRAIDQLRENCFSGLKKKIGKITDLYTERLDYELRVIEQMGYEDYFLIVEDFIAFAREQHILTGPGRGSSAGSLVAYALHITNVDPLRYGLIFERFLNPERITMPDIDVDFVDYRRQEVIDYVAQKYGTQYTAQIITFGTLSVKAVARNVARVFGFSAEEMAFISKEIPNRQPMSLRLAVEQSRTLKEWIELDPLRQRWFDVSEKLEGLPRNASTHAAGIVLSPIPLVETVPLQKGSEALYLTQWAMGDVEEVGLLKMDFLGLRNLTLLDRIQKMIYFDRKEIIHLDRISLQDEETFTVFQQGNTTGIFQFESAGMRETLQLIRPDSFEDLYAINALYRPGPMDYIPTYAKRKHGEERVTYVHLMLEPILKETYGVIVYQEQIMQIASTFAHYTMGEADLLRRAISKKNRNVLEKEQQKFVARTIENGIAEKIAIAIYQLIVKFANYGFPKSHAVAYTMISYQLAYLKAHEAPYFYAALLTATGSNNNKLQQLIREVMSEGVEVLPPSIIKSNYSFTVEKGAIRIGLGMIKGISLSFYEQFRQKRAARSSWKTLFDVASTLGTELFTMKNIEPFIKAGAMDDLAKDRATLLASIDAAIMHAKFTEPSPSENSVANYMNSIASPKYTPTQAMPSLKQLEYEKEFLGFYISEHPIAQWKKSAGEKVDAIGEVLRRKVQPVIVVGLIQEVKRIRTKKGEEMAFVTIQDESDIISCTFFPKQYAAMANQLTEQQFVQVEGKTELRNGAIQILVHSCIALSLVIE